MQTHNYQIQLMQPGQINQEIIFNEALVRLDGFSNNLINGFIAQPPQHYEIGDKYILTDEANKNSICYIFSHNHQWQILPAKKGMYFFCQELQNFIIFDGAQWKEVGNNLLGEKFISIQGCYSPAKCASYLCLYLTGDSQIDLSDLQSNKLTIIIKQNFQQSYNISWLGNLLWPDKLHHQITQQVNNFDVLEFYRLHETGHFLAKIVATNYGY